MLTSLSGALIVGALLAGSANAGDHFIQTQNRCVVRHTVGTLEIQLNVNPCADNFHTLALILCALLESTVGPHVHNVVGASNFSPDSTTPEILQQSKCSSTMVQDDKSIYWTPLVYYNHGNGSYSPIVSSTRIYYFLKPGNGTQPVKAFPKGFRMLAGGYNDRRPDTYPPRGELSYDQLQAMDPRAKAMVDRSPANARICPTTLLMAVAFSMLVFSSPAVEMVAWTRTTICEWPLVRWALVASGIDALLGTSTSPVQINLTVAPTRITGFSLTVTQLVSVSCDIISKIGFTSNVPTDMHGDFINGWNQDTLEQTMQQCNTPNAPEADLQACAPLAKSIDVKAANTCLSEGNIADEDVGLLAPITGFPGCNPYWPAESPTKPVCVASSNVGLVQPSSRLTVDEFKMNLPIANGTSETITGPSVGNMTEDYNYNYGPSSSYAATATSSYADTTTTSAESAASATETAPSSEPTSTGEITPSADVTSTGSSATGTASGSEAVPTEIAPTTTASTEDPASTGAASTGSQATSAAGVSSTESGLANEASATATDSYILGGSTGVPTSSVPAASSVASASSADPTQTTSSDPEHPVVTPGNQGSVAPTEPTLSATSYLPTSSGAPAAATNTASSTDQPVPTSASSPDNSAATGVSSTTSPANAVPTSQNANTLNPGNNSGRPKTCQQGPLPCSPPRTPEPPQQMSAPGRYPGLRFFHTSSFMTDALSHIFFFGLIHFMAVPPFLLSSRRPGSSLSLGLAYLFSLIWLALAVIP
ncbi:hypothetical protein AG1IA_07138 [Rhizoctonia solani AG-1 IA]|uniref:DUF1996 domain-containing protein n=1 Tax=Thanatephorus cucumeris (strain AG1-IA) TaxID=983506 RepID=L8WPZ3_THACA|nr:hypothetical protein AG1IA_07138 [Rhizoctonia solani AG-1 IA]